MSVVAHSPFTGNKRLFEDEASNDSYDWASSCKRGRFVGSPAAAGRGSPKRQGPGSVTPATFTALCGLFPDMDEQVVSNVLAECGQDIDAAIRRLTQLRIDTAQQQQQPQQQQQQQAAAIDQAAAGAPAAATAGAAAASSKPTGEAGAGPSTSAAAPQGPQTAEEWVDALVQEMSAAKDLPDARLRGSKLLHAFEQFTSTRVKAERVEELARENAILKRAVQIQAGRIQEAAGREQELAGLRAMVGQYQERLRALELSNYSLALHLQKATGGGGGDLAASHNHRPDVF